jgi:hypothetical protein
VTGITFPLRIYSRLSQKIPRSAAISAANAEGVIQERGAEWRAAKAAGTTKTDQEIK